MLGVCRRTMEKPGRLEHREWGVERDAVIGVGGLESGRLMERFGIFLNDLESLSRGMT